MNIKEATQAVSSRAGKVFDERIEKWKNNYSNWHIQVQNEKEQPKDSLNVGEEDKKEEEKLEPSLQAQGQQKISTALQHEIQEIFYDIGSATQESVYIGS